jgi:hypothetical protein
MESHFSFIHLYAAYMACIRGSNKIEKTMYLIFVRDITIGKGLFGMARLLSQCQIF